MILMMLPLLLLKILKRPGISGEILYGCRTGLDPELAIMATDKV